MAQRDDDEFTSSHGSDIKDMWVGMTRLETLVKNMLKCDDNIKAKLDKIHDDKVSFEAFKETSNLYHRMLEDKIDEIDHEMRGLLELRTEVTAMKEASRLAKENIDLRLQSMNEFREAMKDQANTYIPRVEYLTRHEGIEKDIRSLRESRAELVGKASQNSVVVAYIIAAVGIGLSVIAILLH